MLECKGLETLTFLESPNLSPEGPDLLTVTPFNLRLPMAPEVAEPGVCNGVQPKNENKNLAYSIKSLNAHEML